LLHYSIPPILHLTVKEAEMSRLFESTSINDMVLKNRFVRSATWEGLAREDGFSTPKLVEVAGRLARGGVGLIISGHAYVSREGQAGPWQLGAYSDECIRGLAEMTETVHALGGKVALQLAHAGSRAASSLSKLEPMGPSVVGTEAGPVGREMTTADMEETAEAFASAAIRARKAGFDAVELHAAHGYLLSQFLSPFFNKREDECGGSIENRSRFVVQVLKAVRKAVGPSFPVLIKLNSEDYLPGGLTVEDMIQASVNLEEGGIDAIEMSGGTFLSGKKNPSRRGKSDPGEPEAYYEAAARRYKKRVRVPLILVGGIRTFETAEKLVAGGAADYVAMSRPLIREPDLVNRWKSGDRRPASCLSDSRCFKPALEGEGVYCVVEAESKTVGQTLTEV
jgi:2,4-dienoyl-CoA reductase-like NADH-dependent reductase (Old Yellow Enzyme family)